MFDEPLGVWDLVGVAVFGALVASVYFTRRMRDPEDPDDE